MMWWLLLFLFCGIFAWILFAPIALVVDSNSSLYRLQWKGIGHIQFDLIDNEIVLHLKVLFWKKKFYPLREKSISKTQKDKPKTKSRQFFSFKKIRRKGNRILKSFHLVYFHLHLDTDDYLRNGYLYPLFYFLSTQNRQLRINFHGDNRLKLKIENRLAKILVAILS